MRFRYYVEAAYEDERPDYFAERHHAISNGRALSRLLGRSIQLVMEYQYADDPTGEWHVGGISILQPQTRVDTNDIVV